MPEFPGGMSELMRYLARNIRYPASARKEKTQADVLANLTIREDGSVGNISTPPDTPLDLATEVTRVINGMPKWKPAKQSGKSVAVTLQLPILFSLQGQ